MCGIVEGGSRHKKQGEEKGSGWDCLLWLKVGSKPGLETVQGLRENVHQFGSISFKYNF